MNKASGGDGIPAELFKILKDDAVKVMYYTHIRARARTHTHTHTHTQIYVSKFGNSAVAARLEKVSFHSNPKEGQCQRMFKLSYNYAHFTC